MPAFASPAAYAKGGTSGDYIERREFRRLMLYIQRHSELLALFDMIDTGGDRRVSEAEFRAAVPLLVGWGIPVDDPAEEWARMDADNGGQILFDEFAHAALSAGLQSGERAAPSPAGGEKL